MNMIFDMKMIETTMKEIGYDAKKMPLGNLVKFFHNFIKIIKLFIFLNY